MTPLPQSVSKLYYCQVNSCSCVNIQLIISVVERGPDHYFKTQHDDADAARIKQSDVLSTFRQINDRHFISTF